MNKFKMGLMVILVGLLPLSLTACNSTKDIPVHSVSSINIPEDMFDCKSKPTKPTKVYNPITNEPSYKDSDAGKYLNGLGLYGDDCKTKLLGVKKIYHEQKKAQEESETLAKGK